MADVDALVAFLRARLDDDKRTAREAHGGRWSHDDRSGQIDTDDPDFHTAVAYDLSDPDGAHIARHDPARVLAEVEAKKRILERHKECGTGFGYCDDAGGAIEADENNGQRGCPDLFALALPYADHPDYRSEWRL